MTPDCLRVLRSTAARLEDLADQLIAARRAGDGNLLQLMERFVAEAALLQRQALETHATIPAWSGLDVQPKVQVGRWGEEWIVCDQDKYEAVKAAYDTIEYDLRETVLQEILAAGGEVSS